MATVLAKAECLSLFHKSILHAVVDEPLRGEHGISGEARNLVLHDVFQIQSRQVEFELLRKFGFSPDARVMTLPRPRSRPRPLLCVATPLVRR